MSNSPLLAVLQFLDDNGDPLSGGKVETYQTGTSTNKATYSDQSLSTLNSNPIILDSAGKATIFLLGDGEYRFVIKTATDVLVDTIDDVGTGFGTIYTPAGYGSSIGVISIFDSLYMQDYVALRAYTGASRTVRITGDVATAQPQGIAGTFQYDPTDTTSTDNGGTTIVGSDGRRWKRVHNIGHVWFDWFEPDPTFTNDNAPKLQNALDYIATLGDGVSVADIRRKGGTLYVSNGAYKLESEVTINPGVYTIRGSGRFKTYPQVFVYEENMLPTFIPTFTGDQAFKISPGVSETSFFMEGFNIATLETGNYPTRAIGFDCTGSEFQRDFKLERVGIFGFTAGSAIETFGASGIQSIGTLKLNDCAINRNGYIFRCLDNTFVNLLHFECSELGQNNTGGIHGRGHVLIARGNSLESNDNTINWSGTFRAPVIQSNYFEANGGSYVISLNNTNGAYVGKNFYSSITATERIRLLNDVNTTVDEQNVIPNCENSVGLITRNNAITTSVQATTMPNGGASVVMPFNNALKLDSIPEGVSEFGGFDQTETSYTSAGNGRITFLKTGVSFSNNTFLAAAFVVRYNDAPVESPRIELRPNSTNTDGQTIGIFFEFNKIQLGSEGKEFLYYLVCRANTTITNFQVFFYPFGLNPTAGLVCRYSGPLCYTYGNNLPGGNFQPFALTRQVKNDSGTWSPVYGSTSGAFTTMTMSSGTEGTWQRIGNMVYVRAVMSTDNVEVGTASGVLTVEGLPFKIKKIDTCHLGRVELFTNEPLVGSFPGTVNYIGLYKRSTAITNTVSSTPSDLVSGASAGQNLITLSGWYEAAAT